MDTCQPDVIENILERYTPNFRIVDWLKLDDAEFEKSVEEIISGLQISEEECAGVEVMTRGQSLNKNWGKVRCVLLTASNFGLICKRKSSTPPDNLIKTLRGYNPIPGHVRSLQHGQKMEIYARREYAKYHVKKCGGIQLIMSGLKINSMYPFLGASADGIVKCPKCEILILEIKCPYVSKGQPWRDMTPQDIAKNPAFCCSIGLNGLILKENHSYFYQIQGQMAICGIKQADFVV